MLIVLADDFSGAAEIGGIGFRYGLKTEIQLDFEPNKKVDLSVIDTNTRSMKQREAVEKLDKLVNRILQSGLNYTLFKKVDSVMRGHLVPELSVLQSMLGFQRIWLLPANPDRGRKIVSGQYEIDNVPLSQTIFSNDPEFPMNTSLVHEIVKNMNPNLSHHHIDTKSKAPKTGLITGDINSKKDLMEYMKIMGVADLCCGAANCFEAFLENQGHSEIKLNESQPDFKDYPKLIINGSTVKKHEEIESFQRLNIPSVSIPGAWKKSKFILGRETEFRWIKKVIGLLKIHPIVTVSIDHPVKPHSDNSHIFSKHFIKLLHYAVENCKKKIVFGITGGSTAYELINSTKTSTFQVHSEVAPGVVTLKTSDKSEILFTVKPGSYDWPINFLKGIE